MSETLAVSEIFLSIQGESARTGLPCTFVRLAGCNLRCAWCDTQYAWDGGETMSIDEIMRRVEAYRCRRVELTGGEPLIQPASLTLLGRLCRAGYETLLETNGSLDIAPVDKRVVKIVDFKCPSSGQAAANRWGNAKNLAAGDEVKFTIADRADFEFALAAVAEHGLADRCAVTFQPVAGRLAPAALAEWILTDGLDVRLGLQLHKIIWPDRVRGV